MKLSIRFSRATAVFSAAVLSLASLVPALMPGTVSAYGSITSRYIRLSSSQLGGTDVTYFASFNIATTGNVGGVVIDFCQTSPIIGDTCTAPTGFDVNESTVAVAQTTISGFTVNAATDTNTLILTNGTPQSLTSGNTVTITLGTSAANDGVSNPTDNDTGTAGNQPGTFYARILTFDTAANAAAYSSTASGGGTGAVDAGGVALSTANQLTITSKVQERLTFCVYVTGTSCATAGATTSINLGDSNGVLDPGVQYTNNSAKFGLSSNAANGVVVNMKGGTLKRTPGCADGTGQNCSIDPLGNSATAGSAGTEQFGVRVASSGGSLAATAPYNSGTDYAFDDNNTTGTQSTYGKQIASMSAGTEQTGTLTFVGNIAYTTESGIYTTSLTFIATGTY